MSVGNAIRTIHRISLTGLVRISSDDGRSIYADGATSVIHSLEQGRLGIVHEEIHLEDGNDRQFLVVRNPRIVRSPADGAAMKRRLRDILQEATGGTTGRITADQRKRMDLIRRFASLWTDAECGASVRFHPSSSLASGWMETCMDLPDRGMTFAEATAPMMTEQRRMRATLKGSRNQHHVQGRSDDRLVMPIRNVMDRLREIADVKRTAESMDICPVHMNRALDEACARP